MWCKLGHIEEYVHKSPSWETAHTKHVESYIPAIKVAQLKMTKPELFQ